MASPDEFESHIDNPEYHIACVNFEKFVKEHVPVEFGPGEGEASTYYVAQHTVVTPAPLDEIIFSINHEQTELTEGRWMIYSLYKVALRAHERNLYEVMVDAVDGDVLEAKFEIGDATPQLFTQDDAPADILPQFQAVVNSMLRYGIFEKV